VPGIDQVTNGSPFVNGVDAETDPALKSRFQNFINTRSEATLAAVEYAIQSTQQGLTFSVAQNTDSSGDYVPGTFIVYVDNGTGDPPTTLLSAVQGAVDAVRPITSTFSVFGPTVVTANVSMTITVGPNGNKPTIQGEVQTAIEAYIDGLGMNAGLPWSRLAQVAYDTDPNITNISSLLLNGGTADIAAATGTVIRAGTTAIN
jgi:phage-related baseplate assembly protein